jgi:hypothetical protein
LQTTLKIKANPFNDVLAQNIILCHILKTKLGIKIGQNVKDDFHSVLRISSAHNKGGPPDLYKHCPNFASFELF